MGVTHEDNYTVCWHEINTRESALHAQRRNSKPFSRFCVKKIVNNWRLSTNFSGLFDNCEWTLFAYVYRSVLGDSSGNQAVIL